jgi:hypothetical protein
MVRRGSVMVRRGSVGSASACCKAGPSSILGSAPHGGFSPLSRQAMTKDKRWGNGERPQRMAMDKCIVWMWLNECMYFIITINVPLFKKLRDITFFCGTITLWAISRDILRGPRLFWPLKLSRAQRGTITYTVHYIQYITITYTYTLRPSTSSQPSSTGT